MLVSDVRSTNNWQQPSLNPPQPGNMVTRKGSN